MDLKYITSDLMTQMKFQTNKNYKDKLIEATQIFESSGIRTKQEFESNDLGIGAYTYDELTFLNRMNDEEYAQVVCSAALNMISSYETAKNDPNLGDTLLNYGNQRHR